MKKLIAEWREWFDTLGSRKKLSPLILAVLYLGVIRVVGTLTKDYAVVMVPVFLYYAGPRLRGLYEFLLPLFLTIIVYDSQRYYGDFIRGTIHVREPFEFDLRFFGIQDGLERLTPSQYFQRHTHPALDVITGFFYIAFIPIYVLIAAYFRFWPGLWAQTGVRSGEFVRKSRTMMWAFFCLNILGYSTYFWYPASPPWYIDVYGFGPARLDIPASPAGCVRFDAALGTHIFDEWYGRSADVHGAIPSLHIAYPLLSVLYAFRFRKLRLLTLVYYFVLCFSAVYLNHHYVLDEIWGSLYAVIVGYVALKFFPRIYPRARPLSGP
jgi:hypothetical protein